MFAIHGPHSCIRGGAEMSVSVITPTGARPQALELLCRMMKRQTYQGDIQWIVVDDYDPQSPIDMELKPEIIRPEPRWRNGQKTQARNLIKGLSIAKHEKILIMEDDDWYASDYIENMAKQLDHCSLVGECKARYYHVKWRAFYIHDNMAHASLCQTGFRSEYLQEFLDICRKHDERLDIQLWGKCKGIVIDSHLCIGMKGLPSAREEMTKIHRRSDIRPEYTMDLEYKVLHDWIGNDADWYKGFS